MRRRELLLTAAVAPAVAGCASESSPASSDSNDVDGTDTPPEATPTPTDTGPAWEPRSPPDEVSIRDVLGATHVAGTYHFSDDGFLNEGAERVADLGSEAIKLWLHAPAEKYPFNETWTDSYESMVDLAKTAPYRELFERPFSTYVLLAHAYPEPRSPGIKGYGYGAPKNFEQRFRDLAAHLLETYDGTGKTFVLQHWEGDNLAQVLGPEDPLDDDVRDRMIEWLRDRQAGVEAARDEIDSDVTVLHATEVNHVLDAKRSGTKRVINEVVPNVDVDLVSYSAWELSGELYGGDWWPATDDERDFENAEEIVVDTLDYIDRMAPDPNRYVRGSLADSQSNVYLGEFGAQLQSLGPELGMRAIRSVLDASLEWGVRWALYWNVYCNEAVSDPVEDNDDVRGHYLVRPDGTKAPTWEYFASLLDSERTYD
jgi:hypothetical protein